MSAGTVTPCPKKEEKCKELRAKIEDMTNRDKHEEGGGGTHGLKHRFPEQIHGANGPGTKSWDDHDKTIKEQQSGLRSRLLEYEKEGCGEPPADAWKWATKPAPKASEWKGRGP